LPVALADVEILWYGLVDHAEDVAVEPDGTVWCGGEEGQVYRGRPDREPDQVAALPGRVYGLVLDDEGGAYCCVVGEPTGLFHVTARGGTELVSGGAPDRACVFPNQPALLDDGTILFTDSGEWGADDGCIFRVADSETTVATTQASRYPNGLAVSPDGAQLAVVESTRPGIVAFPLAAGELGEPEVIVDLRGKVPDGVTYDERRRLLVGCWAPDAIYVVDGERVDVLVEDPQRVSLNSPTNVAFVPGSRRVVVANFGERFLSAFEHDAAGARPVGL
jgi:sugar lactone lactonase YvrE